MMSQGDRGGDWPVRRPEKGLGALAALKRARRTSCFWQRRLESLAVLYTLYTVATAL